MMASGTPHEEKQMEPCTPQRLDELESRLETLTDIPQELHQTSLVCLKPETLEQLVLYLDNHHDIPSEKNRFKDYRGLAELIGLDTKYINHLTKSSDTKKTKVVIERWRVLNTRAQPVLGNLRKFIADEEEGIDRPDVITDLAGVIAKDAIRWERSKTQARTPAQQAVDTSWQLTIDDETNGYETYYDCCIVYADEDELTTQIIVSVLRSVKTSARVFLPQHDLRAGRYELDTTAEVIENRCNGRVIILISSYLLASEVCVFAVRFVMSRSNTNNRVIPIYLTDKIDHVPYTLRGISGLRWFRKLVRKQLWVQLMVAVFSETVSAADLSLLIQRTEELASQARYLEDPQYDANVQEAGPPINLAEYIESGDGDIDDHTSDCEEALEYFSTG